jgi:UDP-N-acetyl-D-glucosamine dehydrogenase
MPIHVVTKIADALNSLGKPIRDRRLLLMGAAYKADVHDTRESPSLVIMRDLLKRGADVRLCDPWVPEVQLDGREHRSVEWCAEEVAAADCVVMLTPHSHFLKHPLWEHAELIVDTRNVVPVAENVWQI